MKMEKSRKLIILCSNEEVYSGSPLIQNQFAGNVPISNYWAKNRIGWQTFIVGHEILAHGIDEFIVTKLTASISVNHLESFLDLLLIFYSEHFEKQSVLLSLYHSVSVQINQVEQEAPQLKTTFQQSILVILETLDECLLVHFIVYGSLAQVIVPKLDQFSFDLFRSRSIQFADFYVSISKSLVVAFRYSSMSSHIHLSNDRQEFPLPEKTEIRILHGYRRHFVKSSMICKDADVFLNCSY